MATPTRFWVALQTRKSARAGVEISATPPVQAAAKMARATLRLPRLACAEPDSMPLACNSPIFKTPLFEDRPARVNASAAAARAVPRLFDVLIGFGGKIVGTTALHQRCLREMTGRLARLHGHPNDTDLSIISFRTDRRRSRRWHAHTRRP